MQQPILQFQPFYSANPPHCAPGPYAAEPQIIGEGDVSAVVSPDGVVQYIFAPVTPTCPCGGANLGRNCNRVWNTTTPVWLVRSIANPSSVPIYSPTYHRPDGLSYFNPYETNNFNYTPPLQIKFHNDGWTSTTDLHYFYPALRRYDGFRISPKGSAAVQVELPFTTNTISHYGVICNNQCKCRNVNQNDAECNQSTSAMSVDDSPAQDRTTKRKSKANKFNTKSKKDTTCECVKGTTEKSITTYCDQGTGNTIAKGCKTQTSKNYSTTSFESSKDNVKVKKWYPKKTVTSQSDEDELYSSDTSKSCICHSETE